MAIVQKRTPGATRAPGSSRRDEPPARREDRRVTRSRVALKSALLDLLTERPYERISVLDITERANVGRSTFYAHFKSKEDLLLAGFDRWLLEMADAGPASADVDRTATPPAPEGALPPRGIAFSLPFLRHATSQKRFARSVFGRRGSLRLQQRIRDVLTSVVRRELDRLEGSADLADATRDARVHLVVGAFLGILAWWVDEGDALAPEEVDAVFQRVVAVE